MRPAERLGHDDGLVAPSPRTSIVIPVFNRAHLVHRALDSALAQTVPCEVILVDHGSTDRIDEVARRYGNQIRYVRREEDRGAVACWRDGVEQATGEFVHITYDDDWLQPTFVERCELLLRDDVAFVYTRATVHGPESTTELFTEHPAGVRPIRDIVAALMRMPLTISPGCALFRRRDAVRHLLPEIPGAGGAYRKGAGVGEDLLLFLLTSLHYPRYAHVPEALADFLAHEGSITTGAQLTGRVDRLAAAYTAAKAYYLRQPGARRPPGLGGARRAGDGRAICFSPHFPWPPRHGAHHRIIQTLGWMAKRYGPVHLVVGRQSNDNGRRAAPPPDLVRRVTFLQFEPGPDERLIAQLGLRSVVDRTTRSAREAFGRLVARERPRVVLINYAYWGRLLPPHRDCFAVIDTHDIVSHTEYLLSHARALAQGDDDSFARHVRHPLPLDHRVPGCERELRTLDVFDLVLAISRADADFLSGRLRRPRVATMGYQPPADSIRPSGLAAGPMRGLCPLGPNRFNEIGLRALDREFNEVGGDRIYVTLTGALAPGPAPAAPIAGRWCDVRGVVADYTRELARHAFGVMVPFMGTGAQVKQYEFARAGMPVVGYGARIDPELFTSGVDAVVVDRPAAMRRAIIRLVEDSEYLAQLRGAARELPRRLRDCRAREEATLSTLLP